MGSVWGFLLYFADLNEELKESSVIIYMGDVCLSHPKIIIPFSYYLALIVKNQSVAINFAKYFNQRYQVSKVFQLGMSINDIAECMEIAKMYLAAHEQMHFRYKHSNNRRKNDLGSIKQLLNIVNKLIKTLDEKFCEEEYLKSCTGFNK